MGYKLNYDALCPCSPGSSLPFFSPLVQPLKKETARSRALGISALIIPKSSKDFLTNQNFKFPALLLKTFSHLSQLATRAFVLLRSS